MIQSIHIHSIFMILVTIIAINSSLIKENGLFKHNNIKIENTFREIQDIAKLSDERFHQKTNSTFLALCRNFELYDLLETIQQVEDRFNGDHHYDWVFLNDVEFTPEFKEKVSNIVSGSAKFGTILEEHWSYPPFIDQARASRCRDTMVKHDVIYGGSESYRHMCRYQSGFFYKHELLTNYKYYWRVEPGVKFFCDLDYDPFEFFSNNGLKYGFTLTMFEYNNTIPSLWYHVKNFMREYPDLINNNKDTNLHSFVMNEDDDNSYNLCHFWSNFEIGDLDFFRSEQYETFFNYLDSKGGFFYERWGDAPIHSIAVSLFLNKSEVHWFDDIGYYHAPFLQCPINNESYLKGKCSCDKNSDFSFDFYSCLPHFFDVMGWELPDRAL